MNELPFIDSNLLRLSLRSSCQQQSQDDHHEFHPAQDPEFLEAFLAEALNDHSYQEYRQHLALCSKCRLKMALYAKSGLLPLHQPNLKKTATAPYKHRFAFRLSFIAAACMIALVSCLGYLLIWKPYQKNIIPEKSVALIQLENTLRPEDHPADLSIAAFGFLPNGLNPQKGFPHWDEVHFKRVEQAYEALLSESPLNENFRLEYASFLLFREQDTLRCEKILDSINHSQNIQFYRLRGLVAFLKKDYTTAGIHFSTVWQNLDQKNYHDGINLAAALLRSGNYSDAIAMYRVLLTLTNVTSQQKIIENIIQTLDQENKT